jgi:Nucleotidyltransferase of unknown function (DUF6036)
MVCSSHAKRSIVPDKTFSRPKIILALQALGDELTRQGVHGQVFIVGGAAMALAYSSRRVTKDIDAVFEPKIIVYQAAAKVADELNLPEDWLNDAVKGFMPGDDPDRLPLPDVRGIEVTTASPAYLLAMKLMAMRFGEDEEDIQLLLRECRITNANDALALLARLYPHQKPPLRTRLFLEELLGPINHREADEQ